MRVVRTPVEAPKANGIAERFVRTVRSECLDRLLIPNTSHLERTVKVFADHYNRPPGASSSITLAKARDSGSVCA
jgi:hypothetical protein